MSRPVIVWILLSMIWGSTWMFIKVGLDTIPPITFAGLRFALATVPLGIIAWKLKLPFPTGRRDWFLMGYTGAITFTLNYALVFWGQQYISSGLGALLYATFPLSGLLLAHWQLHSERLTPAKVLGVILGIIGVGVIFSNQLSARGAHPILGSGAVVLAALITAQADVVIKHRAGHIHPITLTTGQMIAGFPPLLAGGLLLEGDPLAIQWNGTAFFSLIYLAVFGSAIAFTLLYWLMQRMDVTKTMLITLATPLIAVALGIVVLGEDLTWRTGLGGIAILTGLLLVAMSRSRAAEVPGAGGGGGTVSS